MIDKYLRASDEASAIAALASFRGVDRLGNPSWRDAGDGFAVDPIGLIDGATGFHLNIRLLDASLEPSVDATGLVIPEPVTPYRKWA